MSPELRNDTVTVSAAVSVGSGAAGAHVGLVYRHRDGLTRHLHLAFHHQLLHEAWVEGDHWVVPAFEDPLETLRTQAALIANRHQDGKLPYAFVVADAIISAQGQVILGKSLGLTCATFILRLFSSVKLRLLREEQWQTLTAERSQEDSDAQTKLVAYLAKRDAAHASAVEKEVGCARFRGEEVAAASGLPGAPHGFDVAVPAGAEIMKKLTAPKLSSAPSAASAPVPK